MRSRHAPQAARMKWVTSAAVLTALLGSALLWQTFGGAAEPKRAAATGSPPSVLIQPSTTASTPMVMDPPAASGSSASSGGYVLADPQVLGVKPSTYRPPNAVHQEFQADCAPTRDLRDDPIVHFGAPGASHSHTFLGNTTTNADSTLASLRAGGTACLAPADKSGYWFPTLYQGGQAIEPTGPQIIYYKSGVTDYTSVRPFPLGLRFVAGDPMATDAEFSSAPGYVAGSGWECGDDKNNADIPSTCAAGTSLVVRYRAPSCWNGLYLDTPDHRSHMAYPVDGVCPADHPVALPMLEIKLFFHVNGDMSAVSVSSGRGYTFHFDFFDAWDPGALAALVKHCIVGGLQCDARGYDQHQPDRGAVLDSRYALT